MRDLIVYIMSNKTRSTLYIGVTNDLVRRVWEHQSGVCEGFTQKYRLDRLVHYEAFPDSPFAIAREKQIKRWRREKKNALISTENPPWRDLSAELFRGIVPAARDSSTSLRFAQNDMRERGGGG